MRLPAIKAEGATARAQSRMVTTYGESMFTPYSSGYPTTYTTDTANLPGVFQHHRNVFGGWTMEAPGDGGDQQQQPPEGDAFKAPASQADLDRIISDRLAREKAKYADYGDLKAKAARLEEIESANASDLEKAIKKAKAEGAAEIQTTVNKRLVAAEVRALAAAARFHNPSAAARLIDLSDVTVNDSGEVDTSVLKAKLKSLAEDEPYLIDDGKVRPKVDPSQGGQTGIPSKADEGRAQALKRFGPKAGIQQ